MNYNFKILNKCYLINNYINKILCNIPNKEYIIKNNIDECMYNNIKLLFSYKINTSKNIKNKYLNELLINVSMLNYYMFIIYKKNIINNKKYISVTNYLIEIKKMIYGLIDYEKDYNYLVDIEKIIYCYNRIKKNTKNKDKLFNFELYISNNIINIYNILKDKKYTHDKYNIFLIKKPKQRIVMSENLKDKIINYLLCKYYLKDVIGSKLINSNVATRKNKGTKEGIRLIKKYINKLKLKYNKFYILKIDIKNIFLI